MTSDRFCTNCGAICATDSDKCGVCAAPHCARCGNEAPGGSRFRPFCGGRLGAATVQSERRDVTVIFADATDFTSLSHQLDNEDVYTFIDEAMRLLAEVVSEHGGTVDKYMGDGLMAVFGAPAAHEDDAERAVRAAWEMQRIMEPFRERLRSRRGFDFRIRIGVHTGDVVAGRIGSSDVHSE
jgi:adenylate cyclase